MKTYMIALLWGMFVLAFEVPAWAEDLKLGIIDTPKVLDETKEGKKIKDSLAEYIRIRQRVLDTEAEDLQKIEEDIAKSGVLLSPAAKQEKEEVLRSKSALYQRHAREFEAELQAKRGEVVGGFQKKVAHVTQMIAEKEKITLVMEKGDTGGGQVVLFSEPAIDLTERVIKEIEKSAGR